MSTIRQFKSLGTPVVVALAMSMMCAVALALDPPSMSAYRIYMVGILVLTAGIVLVRIAGYLLFDILFRKRQGREAPDILRFVVSAVGYSTLFIVIYTFVFGRDVTGVVATSAVVSVILGLALQDTLGNFFAGLSLHIEQPYHIGDAIRMGDLLGRVESVTWRTTALRTSNNSVVVVPNSRIAREPVEIYALDTQLRRVLRLPAPYGTPPEKAMAVISAALRGLPGTVSSRAPVVRIAEYGDSAIMYEVLFWVTDYMAAPEIECVARERIWYAFRRNNLEIPFPARHIMLQRLASTAAHTADGFETAIASVEIFAPLNAAERAVLAASASRYAYAPGEEVIRCGEPGDSMFVILSGRAEVLSQGAGTQRTPVATLVEGDFFGEMALFTGESRSADVRAATELQVIEISKTALAPLLHDNGELAFRFSHIIAERQADLARHTRAVAGSEGQAATETILTRIKRFFSLR